LKKILLDLIFQVPHWACTACTEAAEVSQSKFDLGGKKDGVEGHTSVGLLCPKNNSPET